MFLTISGVAEIIGVNVGLSTLFENISVPFDLDSNRPSYGAIVGFTMIVIAFMLILINFSKWRKALFCIGTAVGIIGSLALLGYVLNVPILYYAFENISNAMPIPPAVLFLMTGVSLILISHDKNNPVIIGSYQLKTRLLSLFLTISSIPLIFLGLMTYILLRDSEIIHSFGVGFVIVSAITVTSTGFFTYVITLQITKPITSLRNTALEITKGNLNIKAEQTTVDEIGQLANTFNTMIDEIKTTVALQLETEKLKQIDHDKEEFAAMISHELKTPLIPISGYAELFLDGSLGNLSESQREKMQIMYENSIRLTILIQDILDARKMELKKLHLDMHPESIKEIAKRSIDIFMPISQQKNVKLIDETQDTIIQCDSDRILQVFNNIISNALKFVPVKLGTISINSRTDNDTVMISITDNGIGIPKSKQDDLFKKFYQVDTSLTRKSGGTGLGLAISRGIIEAHGGKIWVESEENHGTTIHFTVSKGDHNEKHIGCR